MDPYRFLPFLTRRVIKAWVERERPPSRGAWTPLTKPLSQCRVALISTAGIALRSDEPFDQQGERDDPWWGDPSWRSLPAAVTAADVTIGHLHIDPGPAEQDLDVILPATRLLELAEEAVIGEPSGRLFSIMGYTLDATELVGTTAPELSQALIDDEVDLVLLVPV